MTVDITKNRNSKTIQPKPGSHQTTTHPANYIKIEIQKAERKDGSDNAQTMYHNANKLASNKSTTTTNHYKWCSNTAYHF